MALQKRSLVCITENVEPFQQMEKCPLNRPGDGENKRAKVDRIRENRI